jgi:hypothetical protein
MSTTGAGPLAGVGTLVFDVLGAVVDEAGSVAAETARALAAAGAGPPWPDRVAAGWARRAEALNGHLFRWRPSRLCRAGRGRHA